VLCHAPVYSGDLITGVSTRLVVFVLTPENIGNVLEQVLFTCTGTRTVLVYCTCAYKSSKLLATVVCCYAEMSESVSQPTITKDCRPSQLLS